MALDGSRSDNDGAAGRRPARVLQDGCVHYTPTTFFFGTYSSLSDDNNNRIEIKCATVTDRIARK